MNDIELYRDYKKMIEYYNYANDVMSFDVETICPKDILIVFKIIFQKRY